MRPWLKNILMVGGVLVVIMLLPSSLAKPFAGIVLWGSAIWVFVDARKLEIGKYKKTALSLSDSPFGSAFVVLLLWIIAFPMYISYRQKIINGRIPLKEA